ncbi:hypothetical protein MMPV_000982 [Pyropia vietnamensis]
MSLLLLAALALVATTPSTVTAAPMADAATGPAAMGLHPEDMAATLNEWTVRDRDSDSDSDSDDDDDDKREPHESPTY